MSDNTEAKSSAKGEDSDRDRLAGSIDIISEGMDSPEISEIFEAIRKLTEADDVSTHTLMTHPLEVPSARKRAAEILRLRASETQAIKTDSEEIFGTISKLSRAVTDPMPEVWDRLLQVNAEERAAIISNITADRIQVVNNYVRVLESQITSYIRAQAKDYRCFQPPAYIARFEQFYPILSDLASKTTMGFLDIISREIDQIGKYTNLPQDFLDEQVEAAKTRAIEGKEHAHKTFRKLLDEFAKLVQNMVADAQGRRT